MANYAINGFGRIGRNVLRAMTQKQVQQVLAINDLTEVASHEIAEAATDPDVDSGVIGWYDDVVVRTPQGWRISRRSCRTQWWGGNPAVLQTTPDVHVEHVLDSLRAEVQAGRILHFQALSGG